METDAAGRVQCHGRGAVRRGVGGPRSADPGGGVAGLSLLTVLGGSGDIRRMSLQKVGIRPIFQQSLVSWQCVSSGGW